MLLKYIPFEAAYRVKITAECPYYGEGINTLTYRKKVSHLKTEKNLHFIEVTQADLELNGEEVAEAADELAIMTAEAIDRIVIKMDNAGYACGIANFEEILRKWSETRKKVESMYQGEVVLQYLDEMQQKMETPETLWKAIGKSFFNTAFFNGLYRDYGYERAIVEDLVIPDLLPTQKVGTAVIRKIEYDEEEETFQIQVTGEEVFYVFTENTKAYFKEDADFDPFPASALVKVQAEYDLHAKDYSILSAVLESEIDFKGLYYKKLKIEIVSD